MGIQTQESGNNSDLIRKVDDSLVAKAEVWLSSNGCALNNSKKPKTLKLSKVMKDKGETIYNQMLNKLHYPMDLTIDSKLKMGRRQFCEITSDANCEKDKWRLETFFDDEINSEQEVYNKLMQLERACLLICLNNVQFNFNPVLRYLDNIDSQVNKALTCAIVSIPNIEKYESTLRRIIYNCDFFTHLRALLNANKLRFDSVEKTPTEQVELIQNGVNRVSHEVNELRNDLRRWRKELKNDANYLRNGVVSIKKSVLLNFFVVIIFVILYVVVLIGLNLFVFNIERQLM